jgi:hypothetical protein
VAILLRAAAQNLNARKTHRAATQNAKVPLYVLMASRRSAAGELSECSARLPWLSSLAKQESRINLAATGERGAARRRPAEGGGGAGEGATHYFLTRLPASTLKQTPLVEKVI